MYRFLIKTHPQAATSLRLSHSLPLSLVFSPLVRLAVNLTTRDMKRLSLGSTCMNRAPRGETVFFFFFDTRCAEDTRLLSVQKKTYVTAYVFASPSALQKNFPTLHSSLNIFSRDYFAPFCVLSQLRGWLLLLRWCIRHNSRDSRLIPHLRRIKGDSTSRPTYDLSTTHLIIGSSGAIARMIEAISSRVSYEAVIFLVRCLGPHRKGRRPR